MNFDLSEEQKLIQETACKFAESELAPVAAVLDRGEDHGPFFANLRQLAELGFMGLNIRDDYGGSEAGTVAFSLALTELGKACASTAVTLSVTNMVGEVIQAVGSEEQRQYYLPKICSGEYPAAAFALSEVGAGSDPAGMTTSAVREGDQWRLNGSKVFITSAPYAGVLVVWAVTDRSAPRGKGISCFLVEKDAPGLVIGKREEKMGQHASATSELHFEDCRIPSTALMGRLNDGYRIAVGELAGGRIGIGSLALGTAQAALEAATRHALERSQFERKLADFQAIQWKLADCATELEAARLLLLNAAFCKDQGRSFAKEAAMAKLFASECANRVCYEALQVFGGYGYSRDFPLERYARDVRITTIYEGTSEIQRLIIARELLKSYS